MLKLILIIGWSLILKWENVIIFLSNKSLLLNPKLGLCVWDKVGAHRGCRKCIYEREVCLIKWRTLMWGDNFCSQSSSFSVIISAKTRPSRAWHVGPLELTFFYDVDDLWIEPRQAEILAWYHFIAAPCLLPWNCPQKNDGLKASQKEVFCYMRWQSNHIYVH